MNAVLDVCFALLLGAAAGPATVSLKATHFGMDVSETACYENVLRVAARARVDRPAATAERDSKGSAHRTGPDDADDRRLARPGMNVRMDVIARVRLIAMAVRAGGRWVEIDPGRLDGRRGVCAVALRVVAGQVAPCPHEASGAAAGRAR